ncbi:HPr family phosphocarrier protein [Halorubrum trueperi]|uniref:HPr family phosphocarrier protein n=1 Tax=Halorubrum trueperi TaxID=2004704 RepID=A0ABD5UKA6_9EURY
MERIVTVVPEAGLHARPASKLVQTVNGFDATVSIGRAGDGDDGEGGDANDGDGGDDGLVRADSMLSVSGLNVGHGESVRVVAEGTEAEDALDAVCDLLTSAIDEENGDSDGDGDSEDDSDDGDDDGGETE